MILQPHEVEAYRELSTNFYAELAPANEARLEQLRSSHDPDGRFHTFLRSGEPRDER